MSDTIENLMRGLYPYAESHGVVRGFPEAGPFDRCDPRRASSHR